MFFSDDEWFPIADLSTRWGKTITWIENKMMAYKLIPSLVLPDITLRKCFRYEADENGPYAVEHEKSYLCGGLFYLHGYSNIKWSYVEDNISCADLSKQDITLSNDYDSDVRYEFIKSYNILKSDLVISPQEVKRFEIALDLNIKTNLSPAKTTEPSKENTKIIDGLMKMVIAMAIKGYNYKPNERSGVVNEIMTDIESLGMSLSENTIRKRLQEATVMLDTKLIS